MNYLQCSSAIVWKPDGIEVSNTNGSQVGPQLCSDGTGGSIITWLDYRMGLDRSGIYAQKINSTGDVQWINNGTAICTAEYLRYWPRICSDGNGGAIITWYDLRPSAKARDIYAQKIDTNGNIMWTGNGTEICGALDDQRLPVICSDGNGGAIITWWDRRSFSETDLDIYAQRVDSNGNIMWADNGTAICTEIETQDTPEICSDGNGGAIIIWYDYRSLDCHIYAQRIDSNGNVMWTPNGTLIYSEYGDPNYIEICSDGIGGVIITWEDSRSGNKDIYAQRVDFNGNIMWTGNGTEICTALGDQWVPEICSNENGGAIITWCDDSSNIYTQKIDSNGNVMWAGNGTAICTELGDQMVPEICSDGIGGAIISWKDNRIGSSGSDIYAQWIDSNGIIQWTLDGVAICTANNDQYEIQICSDGFGGAIITWEDGRSGESDIYAQGVKDIPSTDGKQAILGYNLLIFISLIGVITVVYLKIKSKY